MLTRSKSFICSDQGNQGTCYAHCVSKMFSRIIKIIFSEYFVNNEVCNDLYKTDDSSPSYKSLIEIIDDMEETDVCSNELLSALMYRYFYNSIVKNCRAGGLNDASKFVFELFNCFRPGYTSSLTNKRNPRTRFEVKGVEKIKEVFESAKSLLHFMWGEFYGRFDFGIYIHI
jgi:hypothetical protein